VDPAQSKALVADPISGNQILAETTRTVKSVGGPRRQQLCEVGQARGSQHEGGSSRLVVRLAPCRRLFRISGLDSLPDGAVTAQESIDTRCAIEVQVIDGAERADDSRIPSLASADLLSAYSIEPTEHFDRSICGQLTCNWAAGEGGRRARASPVGVQHFENLPVAAAARPGRWRRPRFVIRQTRKRAARK